MEEMKLGIEIDYDTIKQVVMNRKDLSWISDTKKQTGARSFSVREWRKNAHHAIWRDEKRVYMIDHSEVKKRTSFRTASGKWVSEPVNVYGTVTESYLKNHSVQIWPSVHREPWLF